MRAVWSFWSAPFRNYYAGNWASPRDHALAWVVSVQSAATHYPDTVLVTDTPGRRLLVEQLGLRFSTVSTELDRLSGRDAAFWTLGKLTAYRLQDAPFVHIDSDVFLWRRLPAALEQARVFTQNPEPEANPFYDPAAMERGFAAAGIASPVEWRWARGSWRRLRAENCGIVGGRDTAFLKHYSGTAIDVVAQRSAWAQTADPTRHNVLVEQALLTACLDYHANHPGSVHRGVRASHLFASWPEAVDQAGAANAGFTHLIAGAKRAPDVVRRLSARVRRDWPEFWERSAAAPP